VQQVHVADVQGDRDGGGLAKTAARGGERVDPAAVAGVRVLSWELTIPMNPNYNQVIPN
jgi:hypothetical protein